MIRLRRLLPMAALLASAQAVGQVAPPPPPPLGSDAAACAGGTGPAVLVDFVGLKDRRGNLKLELYPGNADDFLKDDRDLIQAGKFFRRVQVATPAAGAVAMCIRAPRPGHYALLAAHDRDGRNKFNFWADGAGFPGNAKLGRTRPTLAMAALELGTGVAHVAVRIQYLHGLGGFGPD